MKKIMVHAVGYFQGFTGYNIHTLNFFHELGKLLPVITTDLSGSINIPQAKIDQLKKEAGKGYKVINIAIHYGSKMDILKACPGFKIGFTVWESTKIPDDWIEPLEKVDQIWIPSRWGKEVLIKNGFAENKIKVVPEGVNTQVFNPEVKPDPAICQMPGYKFLNIGKFEERKGSADLVIAFDQEFKKEEDVSLIFSCHNPFREGFDISQEIKKLNLAHPERIYAVNPVATQEVMAPLYTSCDAFVCPTRAEGWGLPVIEAMASGLPTIITNYSAQTEFINDKNAYLLNYELEKINVPYFLSKSGDYGQWAKPDIDHLKYLMRYVYEHPEEAKEKGRYASNDILENWTWEKAAYKAIKIIENI